MCIPNYPINSLTRPDRNLIPAPAPTNARSLITLVPSDLSLLQSKEKLLFSSSLKIQVKGRGRFGHVLHFCDLAYERDRVQRVKIGGLQPEFAFHQIVCHKIKIRPYYIQGVP